MACSVVYYTNGFGSSPSYTLRFEAWHCNYMVASLLSLYGQLGIGVLQLLESTSKVHHFIIKNVELFILYDIILTVLHLCSKLEILIFYCLICHNYIYMFLLCTLQQQLVVDYSGCVYCSFNSAVYPISSCYN